LHAAAVADLDVFRRSENWPSAAIELTLKVEGLNDPVSASALASALTALDDLILVDPGPEKRRRCSRSLTPFWLRKARHQSSSRLALGPPTGAH
jgi:hypothetical protein